MSSKMKSSVLLLTITWIILWPILCDEAIESLRNSFVDLSKDSPDHFHPKDVEMVKTNDWWLERFLKLSKTEDKALAAMINVMSWRKAYGVNNFSDKYFPKEVHAISLGHIYGTDKEGRPLVYIRGRVYHRTELSPMLWKYMVYQLEKADQSSNKQGWSVLFDATGMNIRNTDNKFFEFFVDMLNTYFPLGVKNALIVDMPRSLTLITKLFNKSFNTETRNAVKFISKSKLKKYIDEKFIPKHLGGQYDLDQLKFKFSDFKSIDKMDSGLSSRAVSKVREGFEKELEDLIL